MRRMQRKSACKVVGGKVQRKNRTAESPNYWNTNPTYPLIDRKNPGKGYIHVLKKRDIKAMVRRKKRTRIQRIIKGFPKAYQPFFNQLYGMALPGHVEMGPPDAMTPQPRSASQAPQQPQLAAPLPTQAESMNRIAQDSWSSQGLSGAWGGPASAGLEGTF